MTVVRKPNIKNGRPIIAGSKISVLQICEMSEDGVSPERIEMEFENISVDDVKSALAYAQKNPDEMEKLHEKRAEAKEKLLEIGEVYQLEEDDFERVDFSEDED